MSTQKLLILLKNYQNSLFKERFFLWEDSSENPIGKMLLKRRENDKEIKRDAEKFAQKIKEASEAAEKASQAERQKEGRKVAEKVMTTKEKAKSTFENLSKEHLEDIVLLLTNKSSADYRYQDVADFIENCSEKVIQNLTTKAAEALIEQSLNNNDTESYLKIVYNLSFETKKNLILHEGKFGKEVYGYNLLTDPQKSEVDRVLSTGSQPEDAKPQTPAEKPDATAKKVEEPQTTIETSSEFQKQKLAKKIELSLNGKITGARITFQVGNVTRWFSLDQTKENLPKLVKLNKALTEAKTREEVQLACYEYLDNDAAKSTTGKYEKSNVLLKQEIARLQGSESKAAKPEVKTAPKEAPEKPKEYKINNLVNKLGALYPEAKLFLYDNNTKLEMQIDGYPRIFFYATVNESGKIQSLKMGVKRLGVGDETEITLEKGTSTSALKQIIEKEKRKFDRDFNEHKEFAAIPGNGEIKDMRRDFKITNPEVKAMTNDEEKWLKNFHNLEGHGIYKAAFTNYFGVKDEAMVAKTMLKITQKGSNDKLSFNDILELTGAYATGSKDFEKNYRRLEKELKNPELNRNEKTRKTSELRGLYDTYLAGMKILKTLENDKFKAKHEESLSATYRSQLRDLPLASPSEESIGGAWNFDELTGDKFPSMNKGQVQIGISADVYNKFNAVWKEVKNTNIDFNTRDIKQLLTAVFRAYNIDELLANGKIKKASEQQANTLQLILTSIPINFTANNPGVRALIEMIDKEDLSAKARYSTEKADRPYLPNGKKTQISRAQTHEQALKEVRRNLSRSEETYVKHLEEALKSGSKSEEVTLSQADNGQFRYNGESLSLHGSAEAISREIFDQPKVIIIDEQGQSKELTIYKINHGVKSFQKNPVKEYFNYLIKIGLANTEISRIFKERNAKKTTEEDFDQKYASLKLADDQDFTQINFTKEQIAAIKSGIAAKLSREKAQQDLEAEGIVFSKNANIASLQRAAIEKGFPKAKIPEIESKIVAGGFVNIKGDRVTGGGVAFQIPINEKWNIILEAGTTGGGVALAYNIVQTDKMSSSFAIGGGIGIGKYKGEISAAPAVFIGYMQSNQIGKSNFDLKLGAGALISVLPALAVGIGVGYNEGRATRAAQEKISKEAGFDKVEAASGVRAKAAVIKELCKTKGNIFNKAFGEYANQLDDADLLSTYQSWSQSADLESFKEGSPGFPITEVGLGVAVIPVPPFVIPFGGLTIRLGSRTFIKPKIGERARMAQGISDLKIKTILSSAENNESLKLYEKTSPNLIIDATGTVVAIREEGSDKKVCEDSSNLAQMNDKLAAQKTDLRFTSVEIDSGSGAKKKALELNLTSPVKDRDVEIYIDPDSSINATVGTDGRIFIPGNAENLVITRETFRFPFRTDNGSSLRDVIIISNNPNFDRNKIIRESKNFMEKNVEDGKSKAFSIEKGFGTGNETNIRPLSDYWTGKRAWTYEDYKETVSGLDKATAREAKEIKKTLPSVERSELEKDTDLDPKQGQELFDKMFKDLRKGQPRIDDPKGIIEKAQALRKTAKLPELTIKQASQFLTLVEHNYFVNIWGEGGKRGKEAVKKAYNQNNDYLEREVVLPKFIKAVQELELDADPAKLAKEVMRRAKEEFDKQIDAMTDQQISIAQIDPEFTFASGTSVRATKEATLTVGPRALEMPGIPKMGIIGEAQEWKVDAPKKKSRDIAKVIYHLLNPSISDTDPQSINKNPLAIKLLYNEKITVAAIGLENYRLIVEAYNKMPKEPKPELQNALAAFAKLVNQVEKAMLDENGYPKPSKTDGITIKVVELANGQKIAVEIPKILSGSYGKCGNISMLTSEGFALIEQGNNLKAARAITNIYPEATLKEESINIVIGGTSTPATKPEPTPNEKGGKDHTVGARGTEPETTNRGEPGQAAADPNSPHGAGGEIANGGAEGR